MTEWKGLELHYILTVKEFATADLNNVYFKRRPIL